jgi:hypothetical protein
VALALRGIATPPDVAFGIEADAPEGGLHLVIHVKSEGDWDAVGDDPVFVVSYDAGDVVSAVPQQGDPGVVRLTLSDYTEVDTFEAPPPLVEQIDPADYVVP